MTREALFTPCKGCGGVAVNFFKGEVTCASCELPREDIGVTVYHAPETVTLTIREMQLQHDHWARYNFPAQYDNPHQPVLGVCEEAGELAHAVLKWQQNIRGTEEEHFAEMKDALADIFVYMMSFANVMDWDLQDIITEVWKQVRARDWVKFPKDGVSA